MPSGGLGGGRARGPAPTSAPTFMSAGQHWCITEQVVRWAGWAQVRVRAGENCASQVCRDCHSDAGLAGLEGCLEAS